MARNHATVNYVEPNDINAFEPGDGNKYSKLQPLEDYCIAMNIEAEVHNRYASTTDKANGSKVVVLSWETSNGGESHVNFMSGTRILRDGPKDSTQNPPYLTTNVSDMYLDDLVDHGTTEAIGIKSVDVSYQSGTVPIITVRMTDVRGLSMMQPNELMRDVSYLGVKGISPDKVAQSFFQCFFRVPYPRFRLFLKGFYGKPVSYEMMCDKFDTNFNSSTGDFDITIHFIGYMYSFLTDVAFQVLAAAPYSSYNSEYWQNEISSGRFTIPDIDGNLRPMPTLTEMVTNYNTIMSNSSGEELLTTEESERNTHDQEISSLESLKQKFIDWYESLYANVCKVYGKDCCFMPKTAGNNSSYLGLVILVNADANADLSTDFKQFDNNFKKLHGDLCAAVEEQKNTYNVVEADEISKDFSGYKKTRLFNSFYVNNSNQITYDGIVNNAPLHRDEVITRMLSTEEGTRDEGRYRAIYNDGANQRIYCYYIQNRYSWVTNKIADLKADANRIAKEIEEGTNVKAYNRRMFSKLGYYPSVENFMKIMFAHLETFMKMMFMLIEEIEGQERTAQSLGITLGSNGNATDVPESANIVPPFPRVTIKEKGDDGITRSQDTWIGDFINGIGFKEKEMVDGLFNGVEIIVKKMRESEINDALDNHDAQVESGEAASAFKPATSYDLFITGKVFNIDTQQDLSVQSLDSFMSKVNLRVIGALGLSSYAKMEGFNPETIGRLDAENLFAETNKFEDEKFKEKMLGTDAGSEEDQIEKLVGTWFDYGYGTGFSDKCYVARGGKKVSKTIGEHNIYSYYDKVRVVKKGENECMPIQNFQYREGKYKDLSSSYRNSDVVSWTVYNDSSKLNKSLSGRQDKRYVTAIMVSEDKDELKNKLDNVQSIPSSEEGGGAYDDIKNMIYPKVSFNSVYQSEESFIDAFCTGDGKLAWQKSLEQNEGDVPIQFNFDMLDYEKVAEEISNFEDYMFLPKAAIPGYVKYVESIGRTIPEKDYLVYYTFTSLVINGNTKSKWSADAMTGTSGVGGALTPVLVSRVLSLDFKLPEADNLGTIITQYTGRYVEDNEIKSYYRGMIKRLRELNGIGYTIDADGNIVQVNAGATETTDAMRIELYRYLKQVHDKWIPSTTFDDWKYERFFDDSTRQSKIYFIDSYYNKIGQKLLISPSQVKDRYNTSMGNRDVNEHMLSFITDILGTSRCMFMCIQNFQDMTTKDGMETMFKPIPYNDMGSVKRSPDFVVVYPYEASKNLNLPNNDFADDGFMLSDEFYTPVSITSRGMDQNSYYNLPAFGVSYGRQYQSYFKDVNVGMAGAVQTQQAIWAKHQILQDAANSVTNTTTAQDLFDLYANQSYTCKVTMMGCAWVQPLMYFVLLNIPMFKGSYMIMKVNHRLVPGDMTTEITACRMANTSNKMVENIFTQSTGDTGEVGGYDSGAMAAMADTSNNCEYKVYPLFSGGKFKGDKPGPVFDNQKDFCVALYHAWISAGVKPEIAEGIVAQEANESNWGKSDKARKYNYGGLRDKNGWWEGSSIDGFVQAKIDRSLHKHFSPDPLQANTIDEYFRIIQDINGANKKRDSNGNACRYCTNPDGQEYINVIMKNFYPTVHNHLKGVTVTPDADTNEKKDVSKLLFEAVQKSAVATDNINCYLTSAVTQTTVGEVLMIGQKDGKTDKLGKVFGLILNGYYNYIQELRWCVGKNQDVVSNPVRIEVIASLKPNIAKRSIYVNILNDVNSTNFIQGVKQRVTVGINDAINKSNTTNRGQNAVGGLEFKVTKFEPIMLKDTTTQSFNSVLNAKIIKFTNEAYKRAKESNAKYINDDLLFSLIKKYGVPTEDSAEAIAELPQFVDNGKFQSEIFKGVAISECGGEGMGYSITTGTGGLINAGKIGDWDVAKSINWLLVNKINHCPTYKEGPCGGWCTRWVKRALQADNFNNVYGSGPRGFLEYLRSHGFVCVKELPPTVVRNAAFPNPQIGDICIFTDSDKAGHTDIFCGSFWASDHKERYEKTGWPKAGHYNRQTYIMRYTGQGKRNP